MNHATSVIKQPFPFPYWQRVLKLIGDPIDNKKYTQTEIAEELDVPVANIYRILYEMERAGFIIRTQDEFSVRVCLTARGRIIWKCLSEIENNVGYRIAVK